MVDFQLQDLHRPCLGKKCTIHKFAAKAVKYLWQCLPAVAFICLEAINHARAPSGFLSLVLTSLQHDAQCCCSPPTILHQPQSSPQDNRTWCRVLLSIADPTSFLSLLFQLIPTCCCCPYVQGVLEPGSGQELILTVWINGGLKGTAQLAAATQVWVKP